MMEIGKIVFPHVHLRIIVKGDIEHIKYIIYYNIFKNNYILNIMVPRYYNIKLYYLILFVHSGYYSYESMRL